MPITEKKYPDWVQKYRTQGKTVIGNCETPQKSTEYSKY